VSETTTKVEAEVTQHTVPDGVFLVTGKRIAIVPEPFYEQNAVCPHCKTTATPKYLSDLNNIPDKIADVLKCTEEECGGVFIIISTPRLYLNKPIFLNWKYEKEGDEEGARKQEQEQIKATEDSSPSGEEIVSS
jgi:hypothetical protein